MKNNQIFRKNLINWGKLFNIPIKKHEKIEKYRKRLLFKMEGLK